MAIRVLRGGGKVNPITERIIACVYRVANTLGSGFLEKVYENALTIELRKNELKVEQQHPIKVFYSNEPVGDFITDLLVEDSGSFVTTSSYGPYLISTTESPAVNISRNAGSILENASSNAAFRQLPSRTQTTCGGILP